jgi:fumarate reductase subunit D
MHKDNNMFIRLLLQYWYLCLFRLGPQNTVYSITTLLLGIFLLLIITVFQVMISDISNKITLGMALGRSLVLIGSMSVYTYFVLFIKSKTLRYLPTLSSLIYSHVLIHCLAMPLAILTPYLSTIKAWETAFVFIGIIYFLAMIFLSVWQLLINTHIYYHALDLDFFSALLVSFGLLGVNILLFQLVH